MSGYRGALARRLSRRRLLQGGSTAALGLAAAGLAACSSPAPPPVVATPAPSRLRVGPGPAAQQAPPPSARFSEWARQARLASAVFESTMPESELQEVVGKYKNQNVTVLVLDLGLSEWMSDDEFADAMQLADRYSRSVRRQGLRAVWHYSALETISPPGKRPWPSESQPDCPCQRLECLPQTYWLWTARCHGQ